MISKRSASVQRNFDPLVHTKDVILASESLLEELCLSSPEFAESAMAQDKQWLTDNPRVAQKLAFYSAKWGSTPIASDTAFLANINHEVVAGLALYSPIWQKSAAAQDIVVLNINNGMVAHILSERGGVWISTPAAVNMEVLTLREGSVARMLATKPKWVDRVFKCSPTLFKEAAKLGVIPHALAGRSVSQVFELLANAPIVIRFIDDESLPSNIPAPSSKLLLNYFEDLVSSTAILKTNGNLEMSLQFAICGIQSMRNIQKEYRVEHACTLSAAFYCATFERALESLTTTLFDLAETIPSESLTIALNRHILDEDLVVSAIKRNQSASLGHVKLADHESLIDNGENSLDNPQMSFY